jgi:uncharacterized protein (TIGR02466 family)
MEKRDLFPTQVWIEQKPEFVDYLNKVSDPFIKEAEKNRVEIALKTNYFGYSNNSNVLIHEPDFDDFKEYVSKHVINYIDEQGCDISQHNLVLTDLWVQEFAKRGGGYQSAHVHMNDHVSAFYFLKCSDKTSYPTFHDPRIAARMVKLPSKDPLVIERCTDTLSYYPKPGTLMIFPSWLMHEFTPDHGIDPFRFIHFNFRVILK